jgi:hypothetical protein
LQILKENSALKDNPDAAAALLEKYEIPFAVFQDFGTAKGERPFLLCRHNRVGENKYRSPWTNQLWPKEDKPAKDDDQDDFRHLELSYNEVWDAYKNLYYGHEAVGSVYLRKKEGSAFNALFGVYKKRENAGSWHSASLVRVDEPGEETCQYRVETFILTVMEPSQDDALKVDLSSSISKEISKECKINPSMITASHIENIGVLIETNEMELRSQLEHVQVPKAVALVDTLMKEKEKTFRPPVNPLNAMMMDSSVLKKKLAK